MKRRKNILFIVSRLPINLTTGDRLRVFHFIEELTKRGHRIDVLGFIPPGHPIEKTKISSLCDTCIGIEKKGIEFKSRSRFNQLNVFAKSLVNGYPFRVWQWHDEKFIAAAKKLITKKQYDVIHFSEMMSGLVFDEVAKMNCGAKLVIDLVDSVAMRMESAQNNNLVLLPFRYIEKKRLKKYEQYLVQQADKAILISERDKQYLGLKAIDIVPNGVLPSPIKEQKRDIDLLFTGNMAYEPNIDAAIWFCKKVMPMIPHLQLYIAGANPSADVEALSSKNIKVTGYVDDINKYYQRAKLFVCPMRLGGGQKNKILEAMMNRAPVISTHEGNIGIAAPNNAIAIADDADGFVQKIKQLSVDEIKRNKLAANGKSFVKKNFSWTNAINLLEKCYGND